MTFEAQCQGETLNCFSEGFTGSVACWPRVRRLGFILAPPLGSCVTLGEWLHISVPRFPHLPVGLLGFKWANTRVHLE